ncbi:MAG: cache domain-containing protein, partial [Clostridia bacterium]|nr:cache domain-containing protein [Clostridia bacterium]
MTLSKLRIGTRLSLIVLIAAVGVVVASVAGLFMLRAQIMEERRDQLLAVTDAAVNAAIHELSRADTGEVNRDEAVANFHRILQHAGYKGSEYFFVVDFTGKTIMHGARADMVGKSLWDAQDPDGVYLFREMVKVAKEQGKGYVAYKTLRPGTTEEMDKL